MFQITTIFVVCMICVIASEPAKAKGKANANNNANKKEEERVEAAMNQFFEKYCNEENPDTLTKLEACEKHEPQELKQIERECLIKVANITDKVTYKEMIKIECDQTLGDKFDKCENDKMTKMNLEKKYPNLQQIVKKIMPKIYALQLQFVFLLVDRIKMRKYQNCSSFGEY
ncbi:unnamed protein product, partial [Oppiella nova]